MKLLRKLLSELQLFDWVVIGYALVTLLPLFLIMHSQTSVTSHVIWRILIISIILILVYLDNQSSNNVLKFLRNLYPLATLLFFYPEIDFLDQAIFSHFDNLLAKIDYWIFGMQPSIQFYESIPATWFNEVMFASYFTFYIFIIVGCIYFYYKRPYQVFSELMFVIIFSFCLYYILFILFPAMGPQYYFNSVGAEIPVQGLFGRIMRIIQMLGEKPAAAFPSSHVGISVIILIYLYKFTRKIFPLAFIIMLMLMASTIYIRAHYFIDVIGGLLTAVIFYISSVRLFKLFEKYSLKKQVR